MYTSVDYEKIKKLKDHALNSVVTILRYSENQTLVDFGAGFIIHVDDEMRKAVVLASIAVVDEDSPDETIIVRFGNGKCSEASIFVSDVNSMLIGLLVNDDDKYCRPVSISDKPVERGQMIATFATVWDELTHIGMYTGSIIHPSCASIKRQSRTSVDEFKKFFAFSCPVAGPLVLLKEPAMFKRLIGAAVFSLDGLVVGLTDRCSTNSYDMKFAVISSSIRDELIILFGSNDWEKKVVDLVKAA